MSENGQGQEQRKPSAVREFFGLLEDQMDLITLEWDYEKKLNLRRLGALVVAGLMAFSAFVFLQAAAVMGIAYLGISVGWSCVILAGVDCLIAVILISLYARRDPQAGAPFQGSRDELRKNVKWIHQLFS